MTTFLLKKEAGGAGGAGGAEGAGGAGGAGEAGGAGKVEGKKEDIDLFPSNK
ncbi:MAG: hypothetical protein F6J92_02060 [Symploca sp. SIO1A3]|nr:hypothetical protein [Symploca sp. SIO1A3]